jgi:hypothetical protein
MHYFFFLFFILFCSFNCANAHLFEIADERGNTFRLQGSCHTVKFEELDKTQQTIILDNQVMVTENTQALAPLTREPLKKIGALRSDFEENYLESLTTDEKDELRRYVTPLLEFKKSDVNISELNLTGLLAAYFNGHFVEGMDYHLLKVFSHNRQIEGLEDLAAVAQYFEQPSLEDFKQILQCKAGFESEESFNEKQKYLQETPPSATENDQELTERNKAWLPKILHYFSLHKQRMIVVVGYFHLYGPHGLLSLLAAKNLKIRRFDRSLGTFVPYSPSSTDNI